MSALSEKFADLKVQAAKVGFSEQRQDTADYFEAVFLNSNLGAFTAIFEAVLGKAIFPSAAPIPAAVKTAIDRCGGVMGKQTLYALVEAHELVFVMLWPWSDGSHITLKAARTSV